MQWKDEAMRNAGGENMYVAVLHQMSRAYPVCFAVVPFFGGFEFSSKAVKMSRLGAGNMQIQDFVLEEPSETQIKGMIISNAPKVLRLQAGHKYCLLGRFPSEVGWNHYETVGWPHFAWPPS